MKNLIIDLKLYIVTFKAFITLVSIILRAAPPIGHYRSENTDHAVGYPFMKAYMLYQLMCW